MKAKTVNEAIRHLNPRSQEEIDENILEEIRYAEIKKLISFETKISLCCLYCWDKDVVVSQYFPNINDAFNRYVEEAVNTFKEVDTASYDVHKIFTLYTIDPTTPGNFTDDDTYQNARGGVKIIFDIEFQNGRVYFTPQSQNLQR